VNNATAQPTPSAHTTIKHDPNAPILTTFPLETKIAERTTPEVRRQTGWKHIRQAFGLEPLRTFYPLRLARYPAMAEAIADHARSKAHANPPTTQLRLLDVGAGRGRSLQYTEQLNAAHLIEWHGVDLESHRVYDPPKWTSLQDLDVEEGLPFESQTFDIAICEQVLEHLEDPTPVIRDIARTLKPGGLFIAGVPTFASPVAASRRLLFNTLGNALKLKTGHPQTFSAASFARTIARSGFDIKTVRGFRIISGGPLLRPLENHPSWYRFNRKLGAALPGLCIETQVLATRQPDPPQPADRA